MHPKCAPARPPSIHMKMATWKKLPVELANQCLSSVFLDPRKGSRNAPEDFPRSPQRGPRGPSQRALQRARSGTPSGAKLYCFPLVLQQKPKSAEGRVKDQPV